MNNKLKPAENGNLEVLTKEEGGLKDRAVALKETIQTARHDIGEKYVDLCKWIRVNKIAPRRVTEILLAEGYQKTRVSEVNRVAQCADELWNEYEARRIGMKGALELIRGEEKVENPAEVEGVGSEPEGEGEGDTSGKSPEDVKKTKILSMAKAAKTILNAAEFLNLRVKKWDLGNGWVLEVKRSKKTVKPEKNGAAE